MKYSDPALILFSLFLGHNNPLLDFHSDHWKKTIFEKISGIRGGRDRGWYKFESLWLFGGPGVGVAPPGGGRRPRSGPVVPQLPITQPTNRYYPPASINREKRDKILVPSCQFKHTTLLQPAAPRVGTEEETTILVIKVLSGTTLIVGGFLTEKKNRLNRSFALIKTSQELQN